MHEVTGSHWHEPYGPKDRRAQKPGRPGEKAIDEGAIDMRDGGTAIPYWDEDPFIREEYEAILRKGNVPSRMDPSLYVDPLKT